MNNLKKRTDFLSLRSSLFFPLLLSVFLSLFLGACFPSLVTGGGFTQRRTQADYDRINQNNQNRAEVIRRTSATYAGKKCSEEDRRHQCYEDCEDIYNSRKDKNECEELTVRQIEKIKEVYEALEGAKERDLNEIQEDVFELYLSFSIQSLDDLIDKFKKRDLNSRAENILIWLAENEEMARIFEDVDRDYKSLSNLLNVIEPFDPSQVELPFSHIVRGSDTIMDIIVQQRNEDNFVLKWFMDFIEESPPCEDTISVECFTVYCKIGSRMNKTEKEKLLDIRIFEKHLNNIIEDEINISNWNPPTSTAVEDIEDTDDLGDDWVDNLCGGLI